MNQLKNSIKYPIYLGVYFLSLFCFLFTKKTPHAGYAALRIFFVATKGKSNAFLNKLIGVFVGKYKNIVAKGVLGALSPIDVKDISQQIERDGFYKFEVPLTPEFLEKIVSYSKKTPTKYIDVRSNNPKFDDKMVLVDENNIISPRYQFKKSDLVQNETVLDIATDQSILAVAQSYLGCKPVLDKITMWWSFPFNKGQSAAAQMYHFDMDRVKFLKFFFYLTDVHTDNGPHCYIRGSHRHKPSAIFTEGRKTDEQIIASYKPEDVLEIVGKKGTILAVDTSGMHKGKPLVKDKRLIFQLEFANTLYGSTYQTVKLPLDASDAVLKKVNNYPYTYKQIFN